jgi:hypothetical protein
LNSAPPTGWRKYLEYLEFLATDAKAQKELVAARMSRGWCPGSHAFKQEMRREAAQRGADLERFAGLEPEELRQERDAMWTERLAALAKEAGIDLARLPQRKSHPDKSLLAAAMKKSTSVSNCWLGKRLGMGKPASASQFARRYMLFKPGRDRTNRLLSRVKT